MNEVTIAYSTNRLTVVDQVSEKVSVNSAVKQLEITTQGLQGPAGPAGQGAFQYTHTQPVSDSTWTVNHGLNGFPNVSVIDQTGTRLWPDIDYVDSNNLLIIHAEPYSGIAYLS